MYFFFYLLKRTPKYRVKLSKHTSHALKMNIIFGQKLLQQRDGYFY